LEANQIQVSSLLVLTHLEQCSEARKSEVMADLKTRNPTAQIVTLESLDVWLLPQLLPSQNNVDKLDHHKAHWSSCSIDLPVFPDKASIKALCLALPNSLQRVKGCTQIGQEEHYIFFERKPDGEVHIRPFNGIPITGSKLLTIGPGSDPDMLEEKLQTILNK